MQVKYHYQVGGTPLPRRGRGHAKVVRGRTLLLFTHILSLRSHRLTLFFDPLRLLGLMSRVIFDKIRGSDPKRGGSNYLCAA